MLEVVNVRKVSWDEVDVYIGRAGKDGIYNINNTSTFEKGWLGNPYRLSNYSRERSIHLYAKDFIQKMIEEKRFRRAVIRILDGRLGCWCRPRLCHGDVIKYFTEKIRQGIDEGRLHNKQSVLQTLKSTDERIGGRKAKSKGSFWFANKLRKAHNLRKKSKRNEVS